MFETFNCISTLIDLDQSFSCDVSYDVTKAVRTNRNPIDLFGAAAHRRAN
jgi:hypothetical protein